MELHESEGKCMKDYGLPEPVYMKSELEIGSNKYDKHEQQALYNKLCLDTPNTMEQQQIFDEIVDAVQRQQTKLYYIQGQAGSGKSTLAKKILAYSRCLNKLCACCASTGLANSCHSL